VGVGLLEGVGLADADADGVGEALALADGDGLALPEGEALALVDGEGLPLADGWAVAEGFGEGVVDVSGPSATGRVVVCGRAAKNRGGRLNVGTSSQKGACGSSAKYRLACGSAALPLASILKGPTSQSAGMARTRKKRPMKAAKNSRKAPRRRRRRSSGVWPRRLGKRIRDQP